jgi:hypothetical protein
MFRSACPGRLSALPSDMLTFGPLQAAYMQLPTDQYVLIPLPNNAKLEKKGENLFTLRVPELQIFNVWLRPHVGTLSH